MIDSKNIDYNEVLYFLGQSEPFDGCYVLFDQLKNELFQLARPRKIVAESLAELKDGYYFIKEGDLLLKSEVLNSYFQDVEKILTVAVTLGNAVDKRIEYYGKVNTLKSVVLDALSNIYIENYFDEVEETLKKEYSEYNFTMRFSCGYGDLGLELQPKIISFLNANKLLGLRVNEQCLMQPLKSITAFIGLSKTTEQKQISPCEMCSYHNVCNKKCIKAISYNQK